MRDVLRAAGVGVATFVVLNIIGEAIRPPFDTLGEWVSRPASPGLRRALGLVVAAALLWGGFADRRPRWARALASGLFASVAAVALVDAAGFARALARGAVSTPAVVPASALVALLFAAFAAESLPRRAPVGEPEPASEEAPERPLGGRARFVGTAARLTMIGVVLAALPLVQMATFGPTRYERPADCAVVFGARVYSTGHPSMALADRVDEAVRLYQRGVVSRIVMSGAVDAEAGFSEPVVMARRAEAAGVPREAIVIDEQGVDTASTVRNAARIMREEGMRTTLVVTHYYHEPRAKMLFDRAGVRAYTVPARMSRRLLKEPYFVLREVAAYYHSLLLE